MNRVQAKLKIAIAAVAVALVSVACAATPRSISIPRVEVARIDALPSGPDRQRFRVSLVVDNQNTEPLPIEEVRFTLRITGQGVLMGRYSSPLTVEALDRRTLPVDVDGDVLSSLSQLRAAAGAGNTLGYEIFGNIILDRAFQNSLPFTASGAVPLGTASER